MNKMSNQRSSVDLRAKEKFWKRFEAAWKEWANEFVRLTDLARFLGAKHDDFNNWKQGKCLPSRKATQLAEVFARLRDRGCDPDALASWVYTGNGEMQKAPISQAQPAFSFSGSILDPARAVLSSAVKAGDVSKEDAAVAITVLSRAALSADRTARGSRWTSRAQLRNEAA